MRHPLVMGNWKLNGSRHMVHELVSNLRKELAGVAGCAVAIAPPEMYIDMAKREAEGSHIMLGAQNVDLNLSGAFTGETSAAMLKDIGAQYIIIGHSERRTYHKESDELIATWICQQFDYLIGGIVESRIAGILIHDEVLIVRI